MLPQIRTLIFLLVYINTSSECLFARARALYAEACRLQYLKVAGVSVHIGSQITDVAPFAETVVRLADFVRDLRVDGHKIDYFDIGGGLGIAYQEPAADFADYVAALCASCDPSVARFECAPVARAGTGRL